MWQGGSGGRWWVRGRGKYVEGVYPGGARVGGAISVAVPSGMELEIPDALPA